MSWIEILKLSISALTLVSIGIAYLAYRTNLQKQREDRVRDSDKELLAQAQKSLQWAYDVLTEQGEHIPPRADRLNWLTSARHLLRQKKIAKRITSETYRIVYAEVEEYWRHRFYTALDHPSLLSRGYFANLENPHWPENLEISSALVIVDFSGWNKANADPTDEVDRDALLKSDALRGGNAGRGLRSYVAWIQEEKARRTIGGAPPTLDVSSEGTQNG